MLNLHQMSKEFLSKCPEIIHEAETARTAGQYKLASLLVREASRDHPRGVVHLQDSQVSDLMRAWRIDVVANTSAAKRAWNGKTAVSHLREAQDVIRDYYNYPTVLIRASHIKKDNEGRQYDFEVEMLRDRARYCLAAAAITGNTSFIESASNFLYQAFELAEDHELAIMEEGIVNGDFEQVSGSYYASRLDMDEFLSNPDRARWMARTYFGESLKRRKFVDCLIALQDLIKIRKNPVKIAQDMVIGVVRSSTILSAPLNFVRRKTLPKGFNSESLKIS